MREGDLAEDSHPRAFSQRGHGAGEVAESISGKHGGAIKGPNKKGAGEMRSVMLDAMKTGAECFRSHAEFFGKLDVNSRKFLQHANAFEGKTWHADGKSQFRSEARPRIARNGNVIDVWQLRAGRVQAELDRARGKARSVFDAIEPLLFDGGNQLAVHNDGSRGIGVICVDPQNDHDVKTLFTAVCRISCYRRRNRIGVRLACGCRRAYVALHPFVQHVKAPWP